MSGLEIAIGIVLFVVSIVVIVVILLQEGRQSNMGAIQGGNDSFHDKGRARTLDAILSRWTRVIAIGFFILVFAGMLITRFA